MTSSTSASERRWLPALVVPPLVGALALAVLAWAPLPELNHSVSEVTGALEGQAPEVVVLGNSVAMAGIDPEVVARGIGRGVARPAVSGGQPAHWLAVLRHRVHGEGLRPERIVLYAPIHQFGIVALDHPRDQELLLDLVGGAQDPELLRAGTGREGPGRLQALMGRRRPLRDAVLSAVSRGPARLIYERPGGRPYVDVAMDTLFGGQAAQDPGAQGQLGPAGAGGSDPGLAQPAADRPPTAAELDASLIPELIEEAGRHGARFTVVVPARRGGGRGCTARPGTAEVIDWLVERGVTVLDMEQAQLRGDAFSNTHHATEQGRAVVSELVGRGLGQTQDSPATVWRPGCD